MSISNMQSQVYSNSKEDGIVVSDQEMQKFEEDLVEIMKNDKTLQDELKSILKDNYTYYSTEQVLKIGTYQTRSVSSSAVKKSIKLLLVDLKEMG